MKQGKRSIAFLAISLALISSTACLSGGAYGATATDTKEVELPGVKELPKPSVIKEDKGKVYLSKDDDDVVLKALTDEMQRSGERLKLGTHKLPYFLQYKVLETDMYYLSASCGAIASESRNRYRRLYTDIRVGDYDLDSSKESSSVSSLFGRFSGGGKELPIEDDYDAIRQEVWMASDSAYKDAIEQYESKKARLKARPEEDRLPEMTKEKPVVFIKPRLDLKVDEQKWRKISRDLSGIFLKYPEIDNAVVHFSSQVGNAWLINNEGFKHRDGHVQTLLSIFAKIRSKDGHSYSDVEFVAADSPDEMPDYVALEQRVNKMIKRLKHVAEAPIAQAYSGPVLFEPDASSSLLYAALSRMMGGAHETGGGNYFSTDHPLKNKLGQRIGSRIINVFDDPLAEEYKGKKLFGAFEVDDDGMPAEKIHLVDRGILKTFCTSRRPTRGVLRSNGHSGDGSGTVSILFVSTEPSMTAKQLKRKLIELGKDEGYEHVYIVRNMARIPSWLLSMGSLSSLFSSFGGGLTLYPTEVYRVSVKTGKEELVRGATVSIQPDRVLRDMVAGGSDETPALVAHGPTSATSIVVPSIILRDVDLKEPPKESEKPPVVPNPLKEEEGPGTKQKADVE